MYISVIDVLRMQLILYKIHNGCLNVIAGVRVLIMRLYAIALCTSHSALCLVVTSINYPDSVRGQHIRVG